MKYVQTSLLVLTLISSIKTLAMNEDNAPLNPKQSISGYLANPDFVNRGVNLAAFQTGVFTWRMIEEYEWISRKAYRTVMNNEIPADIEKDIPWRLLTLRATNRIGSIMLAGFAYEVYLYQRYFKDLKSE
jgi:hypothetical protein